MSDISDLKTHINREGLNAHLLHSFAKNQSTRLSVMPPHFAAFWILV